MDPLSPDSTDNSSAAAAPASASPSQQPDAPQQPSTPVDKLATLSPDAPLPELGGRDEARLLVQSPYRLFLYWNHTHNPLETLRKALGEAAVHYRLGVRLVDLGSGSEDTHPASPWREHWYDARPGGTYRADIGFYSEDYPFFRLFSSETAITPPVGLSPIIASDSDFQIAPPALARVLNETGYVSDALEVALEGADQQAAEAGWSEAASATVAQTATGVAPPVSGEADLAELRHLISALAFGEDLEMVFARISPALRGWLETVSGDRGADPTQLLATLRDLLGFELEYDEGEEPPAFASRPFQLGASSSSWGGSQLNQGPRRGRVWLPSMTPGRLPSAAAAAAPGLRAKPIGGASERLPQAGASERLPQRGASAAAPKAGIGALRDWSPSMTSGATRDWQAGLSVSRRPLILRWRII